MRWGEESLLLRLLGKFAFWVRAVVFALTRAYPKDNRTTSDPMLPSQAEGVRTTLPQTPSTTTPAKSGQTETVMAPPAPIPDPISDAPALAKPLAQDGAETLAYEKGSNTQLGRYFRAKEFDCNCDQCSVTFIDQRLVGGLSRIREKVQKPLVITSAYRCDYHQQRLRERGIQTAKKRSQHQDGGAADIYCKGYSGEALAKVAAQCGFTSIGISDTWCHVDIREGYRRWTYG